MDVIDTMDKSPQFSETVWTQWTLLHAIDRFTRQRLAAGSNPAGPTFSLAEMRDYLFKPKKWVQFSQ